MFIFLTKQTMKKQYNYIFLIFLFTLLSCATNEPAVTLSLDLDHEKILKIANENLKKKPITITDFKAERSAGGIHDYYSEGAYWWENPEDPTGPFIRKDGQRNPSNFREHKNALREFSIIVTTLTAAYQITKDEKYAKQAIAHLQAWFVDVPTRMNPSLLYAQAIKGISTGRGIGIIDTIRLINVALSVQALEKANLLKGETLVGIKKWFNDFAEWLTTHPYGHDERDNNNNHSTWWGAQVAAFARVAERDDILKLSQEQFKKQLDIQMAADGSFPDELGRTKPFHYMNYNLRGYTTFALLASTPTENLWNYKSKNGTLQKALDFAIPFYKNPSTWSFSTDLEKEIHLYQNDFLVFAYFGLNDKSYLELWKKLGANEKDNDEGEANLVIWKNKFSK